MKQNKAFDLHIQIHLPFKYLSFQNHISKWFRISSVRNTLLLPFTGARGDVVYHLGQLYFGRLQFQENISFMSQCAFSSARWETCFAFHLFWSPVTLQSGTQWLFLTISNSCSFPPCNNADDGEGGGTKLGKADDQWQREELPSVYYTTTTKVINYYDNLAQVG